MHLDHVLIAVTDLDAAAEELESRHGLAAVEGGRHPGWGTANRIVPLGDTYLELIAVVDAREAATSPFGRWVASGRPGAPLGWAVRPDDLDAVARRLGLEPVAGSRPAPDGATLRWRSAGVEASAAEPSLPFFLEWERGGTFPGRSAAARPASIARLALRGDPDRLARWLGVHELPVTVERGAPAVLAVALERPRGEIVIGA